MSNLKDDKQKKIREIVSIVKLASLLFSGIVFIRYFFNGGGITEVTVNTNYSFISFFVVILILLSIYVIWSFTTVKKINFKYINIVQLLENLIFILFFIIVILYSGKNTSDYKFIFLFIIIAATIQQGMKQGIIVACISSFFILALDLIMGASNAQVNQYFENDLILAGVFILTAWPLGFYVKIENEHIRKLEGLANEDGLTGIYNHRFFYDALGGIMKTCEKENKFSFNDINRYRLF